MTGTRAETECEPQLTRGERLAQRWPLLSWFVVKWCHEREWPTDWSGGECCLRLDHPGPHLNYARRSWPRASQTQSEGASPSSGVSGGDTDG